MGINYDTALICRREPPEVGFLTKSRQSPIRPTDIVRRFRSALRALICLAVLLPGGPLPAGETSFTEYQVKALFLFNFAKYVDWPAGAFSQDQPVIIAVLGENNFGDHLTKAVEGKLVNGRSIVIRQLSNEEDPANCHILFVSASEKLRLPNILARVKTLPILTVGETDQFAQIGGAINLIKKEGKVRLEIDLNAARQARLHISSKVLSVADTVRGQQ